MESFKLPAGKYYIGDPCYVISDHDTWIEFIESCGYFEETAEASIGDDKFWAHSTVYGDGSYWCNVGKELPVDSGLIGIVPYAVVEKYCHRSVATILNLGAFIEFPEEFDVSFNIKANKGEATHVFGDVMVYTGEESCEDDGCYEDDEFESEDVEDEDDADE
jgi:hypothetical protein